MKARIENSIRNLTRWVEERNYQGYEPADGNSSPLHALTFGSALLQRLLQQFVLRAPVNVRPALGIRPMESPQGRGYLAAGYVTMYCRTRERSYRDRAALCLDWLLEHRSPGYDHYCWGNHFPYATRSGKLPMFEPIVPWTTLIGLALLDGYEALCDSRYLQAALSVRDWLLTLPREQAGSGVCLSYHAFQQTSLHNSNMLAAALLARTGALAGHRTGLDVARKAMLYSCSCQLADGAWMYGEAPKYRWIDNFHTGYNLDALKCYLACSGSTEFADNLDRGLRYFKTNFFEADGRPKYYHNKTYPIDIQCAAQAIETLAVFAEVDAEALDLALRVARWTIDNMQDPDGHFYYRDLGWTKVKTPLLHWGQATMFKALARLLTRVEQKTSRYSEQRGARCLSAPA